MNFKNWYSAAYHDVSIRIEKEEKSIRNVKEKRKQGREGQSQKKESKRKLKICFQKVESS